MLFLAQKWLKNAKKAKKKVSRNVFEDHGDEHFDQISAQQFNHRKSTYIFYLKKWCFQYIGKIKGFLHIFRK